MCLCNVLNNILVLFVLHFVYNFFINIVVIYTIKKLYKIQSYNHTNEKTEEKKKRKRSTANKKSGGGVVPARYDHDHRFNGFFF